MPERKRFFPVDVFPQSGTTGRTTKLIKLLGEKALLFDLVPLDESDRNAMVEKMEDDIVERRRIQEELERISTRSNEVFFKTPLLLKNIIQLVKEKKVDVALLKNSAEVYLMFSMKNLDFHTDQNTSFLELDPPEDQEYLKMSMMICQQKIQNSEDSGNINTIEGISRNVKDKGLCFEKRAFGKKLSVPLNFLQKLGFFDIRKEGGGNIFLDVVHLSYLEFCCAGSLCREGVNIEEELSKIKDTDRFEAVTTYMAGLFSQNPSINFLQDVKHVAKNFLLLLGNDERENSAQRVFRGIMKRSPESLYKQGDSDQSNSATIQFSISDEGDFTLKGSKHILILVEALRASSDRIKPEPTGHIIAELNDDDAVESVSQLIELQSYQVANVAIDCKGRSTTNEGNLWEGLQDDASTHLSLRRGRKLPNSNCDNNEEDDADSKLEWSGWVEWVFLTMCCLVCKRNQREIDMSCDYEAYRLIPTISNPEEEEEDVPNDVPHPLLEAKEVRHNQDNTFNMELVLHKRIANDVTKRRSQLLPGSGHDIVSSEKTTADPFRNFSLLVRTLENRGVQSIKFGEVVCMTESDFQAVCSLVSLSSLENVNIQTLKLNDSLSIKRIQGDAASHRPLLASSRENRGLRSIKLGEVVCKAESDFKAVCSLVSLPSLDRWNIESLKLEMRYANPWKHLSKTAGCGSINRFTAGGNQDVSYWVREEVEAVKTSIEELRLENDRVVCSTNEELKTLYIVLGLAQQWRINILSLPREMSVESWSELSKVIMKGTVDVFCDVNCKTDEEVKAACIVLGLLKKWKISILHLPNNMGAEGWTVLTKEVARGKAVTAGTCITKAMNRPLAAL